MVGKTINCPSSALLVRIQLPSAISSRRRARCDRGRLTVCSVLISHPTYELRRFYESRFRIVSRVVRTTYLRIGSDYNRMLFSKYEHGQQIARYELSALATSPVVCIRAPSGRHTTAAITPPASRP